MGKSRNQTVGAAYAFEPIEGYGSLISVRWRVRLCYSLFLSLSLFPVNPPIFLSSLSGDWAFSALLWRIFSPSVHCGSLGGMVQLTDQNQGKVATSNDPIHCEPATGWCFCFIRACGGDHAFKDCPNKNCPIPMIQLTIKKPASKMGGYVGNVDGNPGSSSWSTVGKNNIVTKDPIQDVGNLTNPSLSGKGGIEITYKSDSSDEGNNQSSKAGGSVHPSGFIKETFTKDDVAMVVDYTVAAKTTHEIPNLPTVKGSLANLGNDSFITAMTTSADVMNETFIPGLQPITTSIDNIMSKQDLIFGSSSVAQATNDQFPVILTDAKSEMKSLVQVECLEEDDLEQFEYEYDDLLVDEIKESEYMLENKREAKETSHLSEASIFTEQELDEFIKNELYQNEGNDGAQGNQPESEASFHSLQNSILSSSSFVRKMGTMGIEKDLSNSTSSKRMIEDGIDDTTSS